MTEHSEETVVKKLIMLLAVVALALGLTSVTVAADEGLHHSGRVIFVSGDFELAAGEQADALIVVDGDASVAGTVNTLVVIGGSARLEGAVVKTLAITNGSAELDAEATVLGDVLQLNADVHRASGAVVGGQIKDIAGDVALFGVFIGLAALAIWVGFGIATLVAGLLVAGLAARQARAATALIRQEPGKTALTGLLALVLPPVLAVLAMATIIGIPAGLGLLVVVWPAVAFIGYIVAAIWLGEWLLERRAGSTPAERPYAAVTVGLLVAFVIGLIPIVTAVLSILGLGAVVLAGWRTLRGDRPPRVALEAHAQPAG
jgi:hypothetical protein